MLIPGLCHVVGSIRSLSVFFLLMPLQTRGLLLQLNAKLVNQDYDARKTAREQAENEALCIADFLSRALSRLFRSAFCMAVVSRYGHIEQNKPP
jgi:hypothetical protein